MSEMLLPLLPELALFALAVVVLLIGALRSSTYVGRVPRSGPAALRS